MNWRLISIVVAFAIGGATAFVAPPGAAPFHQYPCSSPSWPVTYFSRIGPGNALAQGKNLGRCWTIAPGRSSIARSNRPSARPRPPIRRSGWAREDFLSVISPEWLERGRPRVRPRGRSLRAWWMAERLQRPRPAWGE